MEANVSSLAPTKGSGGGGGGNVISHNKVKSIAQRRIERANMYKAAAASESDSYDSTDSVNELSIRRHARMSSRFSFDSAAVPLDLSRGIVENTEEIIGGLSLLDASPDVHIALLNNFAKLCAASENIDCCDKWVTEIVGVEEVVRVLRRLTCANLREVRAAAFRCFRYALRDPTGRSIPEFVRTMMRLRVDVFIMQSLEKDQSDIERAQALKVIRQLISSGPIYITRGIVSCICSVANERMDRFSGVCLETLCELAIRRPRIAVLGGCISTLVRAILSASSEIMVCLVSVLLYLLNHPASRSFVRADVDLEAVLSPITDAYYLMGNEFTDTGSQTTPNKNMRFNSSRVAVVAMARTWTGMLYLCADNNGLRALLDALYLPQQDTRSVVLDILFDLLHVPEPEWTEDFLTAIHRSVAYHVVASPGPNGKKTQEEMALTAFPSLLTTRQCVWVSYMSITLACVIRCGILEALVEVVKSGDAAESIRATVLLGDVLDMTRTLLPPSYMASIQTLPSLMALAVDFQADPVKRTRVSKAVSNLLVLHKTKVTLTPSRDFHINLLLSDLRHLVMSRALTATERALSRAETMKREADRRLGDSQVDILLRDSGVLAHKDYNKWHCPTIVELLAGPLRERKRLDEILATTKFVKRLLTFFRPYNGLFSVIPSSDQRALKFVRVGCLLIDQLLCSEEGIKILKENDLLSQIAELFGGGDSMLSVRVNYGKDDDVGASTTELGTIIDSGPEALANTLCGEYFTLIGRFFATREGVTLLERHGLISCLHAAAADKERDDLQRFMITRLDYSMEGGHSRLILTRILTAAPLSSIRRLALNHVHTLLRGCLRLPKFMRWCIDVVMMALYDSDYEVASQAVAILSEASNNETHINVIVEQQPALMHLGEPGRDLQLRFLGTLCGFMYLQNCGFVELELKKWTYDGGNEHYVKRVEIVMARSARRTVLGDDVLGRPRVSSSDGDVTIGVRRRYTRLQRLLIHPSHDDPPHMDASLPAHLFGELSRTRPGAALLVDYIDALLKIINQSLDENPSLFSIIRLKAALWAVAHVGSNDNGINSLPVDEVVARFVALTYECPVLSIRGTCFYSLALFARTRRGTEALHAANWDTVGEWCDVDDNFVERRGLALPRCLDNLLDGIPKSRYVGSWASTSRVQDAPVYVNPKIENVHEATHRKANSITTLEEVALEVFRFVGNLSTDILGGTAKRELRRLRSSYPAVFVDAKVFARVLNQMSAYSYQLGVRRFVSQLFSECSYNDVLFNALEQYHDDSDFHNADEMIMPTEHQDSKNHSRRIGPQNLKVPRNVPMKRHLNTKGKLSFSPNGDHMSDPPNRHIIVEHETSSELQKFHRSSISESILEDSHDEENIPNITMQREEARAEVDAIFAMAAAVATVPLDESPPTSP